MLQRVLNSAGIDVRSCAELLGFNPDMFVQWAANPNQIPQSVVPLLSAVLSVPQSLFTTSPKAAKHLKDEDVTPQIWYKFLGEGLQESDREYVVLIRQIGHFLNELPQYLIYGAATLRLNDSFPTTNAMHTGQFCSRLLFLLQTSPA